MKRLKKGVGIVLSIAILSTILCLNVFATESYNLKYEKSPYGPSYICTGIDNKYVTSVEIPSEHDGLPVSSIGDHAFVYHRLTEITIPESVTSIGKAAFGCCKLLTKISLPNKIKYIGDYAFNTCTSLKEISLPNSIISIGPGAFEQCLSLKEITIPNNVINIGDFTFFGCKSLEKITIPNKVSSFGWYSFDKCDMLTSVFYTGTEDEWNNIGIFDKNTQDILNNKDITYLCNVPTITEVTGNPTKWVNGKVKLTVSSITNPEETLNAKPYSFSTKKGVYNWQAENTATFDHNQTVYIYMRNSVGDIALRKTVVLDKFDNTAPIFTDVSKDSKAGTNSITLTINGANDDKCGLSDTPYSFSTIKGVYNWQAENTATFTKSGTVYMYVRDKLGNITYCGYKTINVTPKSLNPDTNDNVMPKNLNPVKPQVKRSYNTIPSAINQNISDDVTLENSNLNITTEPITESATEPATTKSSNNKSKTNKKNNWKIGSIVVLVAGGVVAIVLIIRKRK